MPIKTAPCRDAKSLLRILLRSVFAALALGDMSLLLAQEAAPQATPQATTVEAERLLDLPPFDRITLKTSHDGEVLKTLLLDLPGRQVPAPYPTSGDLKLYRVSEPSVLYAVPWAAIEKIELYEHLLLGEAIKQTRKKNFVEAYAYLQFLHNHYPKLSGLQAATERYLKGDAFHAFAAKNYDESLSILLALYDLNPSHRRLAEAVQAVTDRQIAKHLAKQDFASARSSLDAVESAFSRLKISSLETWRKKFRTGAEKQLAIAKQNLKQGQYSEARQAIRQALAILPNLPDAKQLVEEINRRSPQVVVGVSQHSKPSTASSGSSTQLADVATARVSQLTNPRFVELTDFGGEGGIYTCQWARLESDDSGLQLSLNLNEQAFEAGISPEGLALQMMRNASFSSPDFREEFAGLLQDTAISNGNEIRLHWLRPHVRPEALLQFPLRNVTSNDSFTGTYRVAADEASREVLRYEQPNRSGNHESSPSIVEQIFVSEEAAITALSRGNVDVLERIAPWQIDRIRQIKGVVVGAYRLPTIHVLVPNYSKPLMRRREFRRALCYGINRPQILKDILLGGEVRPGFQILSGPLPAGVSLSDPLGYAYNRSIKPRPYEPRLAAVLATVARSSLSKSDENKNDEETPKDGQPTAGEVAPLVLAHPPDPLARAACQTIKLQLDAIGIPIDLLELSRYADAEPVDYDLKYTEFPLWEPLVDLRRLLGPNGPAGSCSPAMSLALASVDHARNWKEARTRLQHVHEVAYYDLPVVPLWQTVNFFAHRKTLQGIRSAPVTIYQDVASWKSIFLGASK